MKRYYAGNVDYIESEGRVYVAVDDVTVAFKEAIDDLKNAEKILLKGKKELE